MPARLEFADLLGIELPASRPYQTFAGFPVAGIRDHPPGVR